MTATSLIVQGSRVSLITDAAFYQDDGRIAAIASKVAIEPDLGIAIAVSGSIQAYDVAVGLEGAASQAEALERLPAFGRVFRQEKARRQPLGEASGLNEFTLFLAIWSDRTDRPEGWIYSSTQGFLGAGYRPGTLVEVELVQLPLVERSVVDLETFDPIADPGRRVMGGRQASKGKAVRPLPPQTLPFMGNNAAPESGRNRGCKRGPFRNVSDREFTITDCYSASHSIGAQGCSLAHCLASSKEGRAGLPDT